MSSTAILPAAQTLTAASSSPLSSSTNATRPTLRSTPTRNSSSPSQNGTPKQLGQHGWTHPRMDEVIRRRDRTNFDASNLKAILMSVLGIVLSLIVPNMLQQAIPSPWADAMHPYPMFTLWTVRLFFIVPICRAIAPLLLAPDTCEDIPLDPVQRQLLGLPPMSRPATPAEQEKYVTPPRFSRSNTPRSTSSSLRGETSGSPLSGRGTPLNGSAFRMSGSGSPFATSQQRATRSPRGASGLTSGGERRRLSYTGAKSSPLSLSEFEDAGSLGTPSKGGSRASVGLNNKWLYEKGKGSPKGLFASRGPSFF